MSNITIEIQQTNQLPAGYKQTAVGVIPEDWEVKRFDDIFEFHSTNSFSRENLTDNETESKVKNIHYGDIHSKFKNGILNCKEEKLPFIKDELLLNKNLNFVQEGDLIIADASEDYEGVGECVEVLNVGENKIVSGLHTFLARDYSNETIIGFRNYIFKNQKVGIELKKIATGISVYSISKTNLQKLLLPTPPLPEQQKIAEILSTWDNAIDNCKKIIKKLKKRNKGLAQQLLTGKTRVKGFEDTKWENKRLKDIAIRVTAKNEELNDTVVTISAQRGFVLQEDFFNKRVASDTLLNYYLLKKGQFAYNKSYSNGYPMGAFKRLDNFEKAVVTTLYICFELKKNVDSDFMNYFFENGMMVNYLMKVAQEGGRAHGLLNIGLDDFFNLKLTIPSKDEQEKIVSILVNATNELKQYEQKLANLQIQKKGLMQQLLTGKVRVKLNK